MSLCKPIIRNKTECVHALSEALPDVTEHVLRLIAEFVPYRELLSHPRKALLRERNKGSRVAIDT